MSLETQVGFWAASDRRLRHTVQCVVDERLGSRGTIGECSGIATKHEVRWSSRDRVPKSLRTGNVPRSSRSREHVIAHRYSCVGTLRAVGVGARSAGRRRDDAKSRVARVSLSRTILCLCIEHSLFRSGEGLRTLDADARHYVVLGWPGGRVSGVFDEPL